MAAARLPAPAQRVHQSKTPVTIITGFLGAGKTTLLNYILKEKGSRSIAVIENEFGEVNIDRELVAENLVAKEDLVSLENGCVCCSLRKDIVKAFAEIERRSRQQPGKRVDAIVLETTGLADPAPVAFTFFANPWIASRFRLDSIICVVDARYLMQHLEDGKHSGDTVNEAVQQIAFADLILLNKVDLVKDATVKAGVLSAIRGINNSARIIECQLNEGSGRPPMDQLLFNNLFSVNRVLEQIDPGFLDSDSDSGDEGDLPSPPSASVAAPQQQPAGAQDAGHSDGGPRSEASATGDDGRPSRTATAAAAGNGCGADGAAAAAAGNGCGADGAAAAAAGSGCGADGAAAGPQSAAERSAGQASASKAERREASRAALLRKYRVHGPKPQLVGAKHKREAEPESSGSGLCEDQCEECSIVDGEPIKGDRNPKRRAKRLHDLSDVSSVGIMARGQLDEYRFNMYMRDLLAEKAKDIFRCKGVLSVHGYGNTKFVFQGVHETICYGPAETAWRSDEHRINQVVFIGRGLDRKALIEGFRTCVWVPLPDGWDEFRDATTNQPYYVCRQTSQKTWTRPEIACARVVATQGGTQQPTKLLPKRQPSVLTPSSQQAVINAVQGKMLPDAASASVAAGVADADEKAGAGAAAAAAPVQPARS